MVVVLPPTVRLPDKVELPETVRAPRVADWEKRLVDEAVVEKKLVVVAEVPVA